MKRLLSLALAGAVLLTGCGGAAQPSVPSSTTAGPVGVTIAAMVPLSGPIAALGESVRFGAELALKDKAADLEKAGLKVTLSPMDDQAKPEQGAQLAEQALTKKEIVALVGPLTSGVAIPVSQKLSAESLAIVAPASTAVQLTERNLANVNRLVARDDAQGPAAAAFIKESLKAPSLFIIHDKSAYGQGLADEVKKAATAGGLKVDGYEGINPGDKDFSAVLSKVKAAGSPVLYYGGMHNEAAQILKQLKEKGISLQFMGGDGLDSGDLIKLAGEAAKGIYYTSVVADITKSEEGKAFAKRYAEYSKREMDSFAAYGYDSTLVVLNALTEYAKANPGKAPTRKEVAELIRRTAGFRGVASSVTFDAKGDNKDAKVFVYQYQTATYPGVLVR